MRATASGTRYMMMRYRTSLRSLMLIRLMD